MSYKGFGYVVDSCPLSQEETTEAAFKLNCSLDEKGRSQYVCVPNENLTSIVEFCYTKSIVALYQDGHCLKTLKDGFLDQISCKSFTEGCPAEFFRSTDLYKYPACHRLNTVERCFLADPSCNASSTVRTSTSVLGVLNTTIDYISYSNVTSTAVDDKSRNLGAIIGVVVSLLILLGILIVLFAFWRCRQGLKGCKRNLEEKKDEDLELNESRKEMESLLCEAPSYDTKGKKDEDLELNESREEIESLLCEAPSYDTKEKKDEDLELNESRKEMESLLCEAPSYDTRDKKEDMKIESEEEAEIFPVIRSVDGFGEGDKKDEDMELNESEEEIEIFSVTRSFDDVSEVLRRSRIGYYSEWKTSISDQFSTLTDDEVSLLYCFLCSDSVPPDFTDTEWLDMLNEIRQRVYRKEDPVTSEEAQQTLDRLKSCDFLWENQRREHLTRDTKDEIMYRVSSRVFFNIYVVYYLSSFVTAQRYLRSVIYNRKPGEKCVTGDSSVRSYSSDNDDCDDCDSLLIRRLQMDILTHVTMEDRTIFDRVTQILNMPLNILGGSKKEREEFLAKLKETGESVHYRGRSQDSVQHATWLWRYGTDARPDIVRSCIGLHQHWDIYIIDNKAYRNTGRYHAYPPGVRCLLYCLLLVDDYTVDVSEPPNGTLLSKLRERYFTDLLSFDDESLSDVPEGITDKQGSKLKFKSDDIRHDVMYAFVTECLVEDSDLEFFLTTASRDVISEYCRSWGYKKSEGERCLYVPNFPDTMYDLFIDKLQMDIITHCTVSDRGFRASISNRLGVPEEVLKWDLEARERYVEYAKRGTQTVHHARGMIVGCAGAGKTTLLKRLMGCSEEELRNVKSTEGLEVHEEIFQIEDEKNTLKAFGLNEDDKKGESFHKRQNARKLSFFDFGGQCAYYACHQIYLTRRAFYVVVVDASKSMDQQVDKAVCDQDGSVFSGWTYGDYFVFWLKSIHTYCSAENKEDQKPIVLIVATHWDVKNKEYKDKDDFMENLLQQLPSGSHLLQYIKEDNSYCVQFPVPLHDLENRIADIARHLRWTEKIPKEWVIFEIHLQKTKKENSRDIKYTSRNKSYRK